MKKIIIIGGGAAGLMTAISAKKSNDQNCKITIIEKNERPGRKLAITGKGRCNVTNNCSIDEFISSVPRNSKFLYSSISGFTAKDTMDFFIKSGVQLKTERGRRVFPVSDKSYDIVDALVKEVKDGGTQIVHEVVTDIVVKDGIVSGVTLQNGEIISADSVVLATGGKSYPLTGSTGDGYILAEKLGHNITELTPSLVPLTVHEGFCTRLSGLSLKNVRLSFYENNNKKPLFSEIGEMLFTHFGISGPLVLSASAHLDNINSKNYYVSIDLKPGLTEKQLDARILRDFADEQNKDFGNSLYKLIPKSLVPVVVSLSGISPDLKINQISREQRNNLCLILKQFKLHITGFRPIEEAIITRGGVSVNQINSKTMESKLVKGLYFAGEIIDVDAYTGGYNLQIAFSTGYAAGQHA